jgi:hypothetical protein
LIAGFTMMIALLKRLRERWANWCGDRDLELAIRRHLTADGFYGGSAKLTNVRLAAVQRPGWLQVYRFEAVVKLATTAEGSEDDDESEKQLAFVQLFGLVREDARRDETIVRTFATSEARRELFQHWSTDLVQLRGGQGIL